MADPRLGEFERIARFFAPLAGLGSLGLLDDVALIDGPPGRQLVLTVDAIVAGVDYLPDDPADLVARKLLRVNLSDLAAKGATPFGYLLTTVLPASCDESWLAGFSAGLAADQAEFAVVLLGGDSSGTPGPATLSVTALGLRAARGDLAGLDAGLRAFLVDRYRLPRPRLALGQRLVGIARAMIDASDGLVGDLGQLCAASGVAAIVEAANVPLSVAARTALDGDKSLLSLVLGGGDDYELIFAAPRAAQEAIVALARSLALPIAAIGYVTTGTGVRVIDERGRDIELAATGYRHF